LKIMSGEQKYTREDNFGRPKPWSDQGVLILGGGKGQVANLTIPL